MYELQQRNIDFCVRLKDNWWREVNAMLRANETDKIVRFILSKEDKELQNIFKSDTDTITVRLVVIELNDGKKEILCTSLVKTKIYSLEDLTQLYNLRWGNRRSI